MQRFCCRFSHFDLRDLDMAFAYRENRKTIHKDEKYKSKDEIISGKSKFLLGIIQYSVRINKSEQLSDYGGWVVSLGRGVRILRGMKNPYTLKYHIVSVFHHIVLSF